MLLFVGFITFYQTYPLCGTKVEQSADCYHCYNFGEFHCQLNEKISSGDDILGGRCEH